MKKDTISSAVLFIAGLVFIFIIIPRQSSPGDEFGMPPALLPTVAMIIITVLAFVQFLKTLVARKREADNSVDVSPRNWLNLLIYAVLLFLSLGAMKFLGFIPGGIFAIVAFSLLMGNRNPFTIALMSIPPPLIVFLALRYGLKIPMP